MKTSHAKNQAHRLVLAAILSVFASLQMQGAGSAIVGPMPPPPPPANHQPPSALPVPPTPPTTMPVHPLPPTPPPPMPAQPIPPASPTVPKPAPVVPLPLNPPPAAGVTDSGVVNASHNGVAINSNAGTLRRPPGPIGASLNSDAVVGNIGGATTVTRNGVLTQVDTMVQTSNRAMADLHGTASGLTAEARRQFDAAYATMQAKENALKGSVSVARLSAESSWLAARDKLAADYQAYAQAVTDAEASAQVSLTRPPVLVP